MGTVYMANFEVEVRIPGFYFYPEFRVSEQTRTGCQHQMIEVAHSEISSLDIWYFSPQSMTISYDLPTNAPTNPNRAGFILTSITDFPVMQKRPLAEHAAAQMSYKQAGNGGGG